MSDVATEASDAPAVVTPAADEVVDAITATDPADRTVASLALRSPALARWGGRLALVGLAALLFVWPDVIGDPTRVRQWSEYLCYATIAVGIDLAWGYGGMLVLGQGVFFGLGAYAMGMYLSLEQVSDGALPQFMSLYSDYDSLPVLWRPFRFLWFAAPAAVLVPMLVAGLLGWLVFTRRIRGAFFAILTQATALVFWLILVGQLKLTAGTNGLTNFSKTFGRSKYDPTTTTFLYTLAAVGLLATVVVARQLVRSRFGRLLVATRDGEDRVRFLGYNPATAKTIAFMVAAGMAGLAGAFAAPIIGIVAPNQFAVLPSILMITWVAIGGRGSLWGAVLGAFLVSWANTGFSESRPDDWLYLQGLLFVVVVAFVPGGLAGVVRTVGALVFRLRRSARQPASNPTPEGVVV
ncbi:MAG: urea ABC transporter permease subunit UrtC [Actinomycetota bacterium]|nr:urea ABC transporter permease subunit UrtC [Actinomycetota bacterium]